MILYINHLLMWIFFHGHWNALRSCARWSDHMIGIGIGSLSRRSMWDQRPYHTFHRCSKCCGQCTNAEGLSGSSLSGRWKRFAVFFHGISSFFWDEQFISNWFWCWTRFLIRDQSCLSQTWEGGPPIYVKTMWFYMFLIMGMEWLEWDSVV